MRKINCPSPKSSILRALDDWASSRFATAEIVFVIVSNGKNVCVNFRKRFFGLFFGRM